MSTDNDQDAVEMLCKIIDDGNRAWIDSRRRADGLYTFPSYSEVEMRKRDEASTILDAIRAGRVPGIYTCKTDAEMGRYHVAYCEQLKQERDAEKDRADKAEAWNERFVGEVAMLTKQRDRLAGLLRESNEELEEQWSRTTDGHNSRRIREVMDRNDAALAEIGGGK